MRLGSILKKWRLMSDLDLRTAGTQMGIAASTLMRIEAGRVPDGVSLIKIQAWLFGADANEIPTNAGDQRPNAPLPAPGA